MWWYGPGMNGWGFALKTADGQGRHRSRDQR
jgi:hypothetical protein